MNDLPDTVEGPPDAGQRAARILKNIGVFLLVFGVVTIGSKALRGNLFYHQADGRVVVATHDLSAGAVLTAADTTVGTASLPAGVTPVAADRKNAMIGSILLTDVMHGAAIPASAIAAIGSGHSLAAAIAAGRSAVTIPAEHIGSGTESLAPGDRVDVLLTTESSKIRRAEGAKTANADGLVTALLVHEARVLQISAGSRHETRKGWARNVTLDLSPDDAQKVALGMSVGTLHVIVRNGDDLPQGLQVTTLPEILPMGAQSAGDTMPQRPKVTVVTGTKTQVIEVAR